MRAALLRLCVLLMFGAAAAPAYADAAADKAAITARLHGWAAAFNARDAAGTCDLFAVDLIATVPDALQAGRDAVCTRLAATLVKRDVQFTYQPDIHEIIVSGDIAVVRLTWTLTTQRGSERQTDAEAGIDIFRRQPDGTWSIARFMAFSTAPSGDWGAASAQP